MNEQDLIPLSIISTLIKEINIGYTLHEIALTNGRAEDYIFLHVNEAFERFSGLKRSSNIGNKHVG